MNKKNEPHTVSTPGSFRSIRSRPSYPLAQLHEPSSRGVHGAAFSQAHDGGLTLQPATCQSHQAAMNASPADGGGQWSLQNLDGRVDSLMVFRLCVMVLMFCSSLICRRRFEHQKREGKNLDFFIYNKRLTYRNSLYRCLMSWPLLGFACCPEEFHLKTALRRIET